MQKLAVNRWWPAISQSVVRSAKNAIRRLRAGRKRACELTGTECVRNVNGLRTKFEGDETTHRKNRHSEMRRCAKRVSERLSRLPHGAVVFDNPLSFKCVAPLCAAFCCGQDTGGWLGSRANPRHLKEILPSMQSALQSLPPVRGMWSALDGLECRNCYRAPGLRGAILTLRTTPVYHLMWRQRHQGILQLRRVSGTR